MPKAASAAERAAQKWSTTTQEAGRSSEEFSRRVRKTIADLEFERQQLARSATERQKYAILRRAGVAEASAEGVAILASVKALQAQKEALGQTSLAARAATGAMGGLRTAFAALGPVALVMAAIATATKAMGEAFSRGSGLGEAAEQIGITTDTLQALQHEAVQAGLKVEDLDTAISKFSQKMGDAAEGDKAMIESLQRLGVKNLDLQGKLRPTEDLLTEVARAISEIDDPARRSAAAVDFFGKSGTRMLTMLQKMGGGFDSMKQKAQEAGDFISSENAARLDKAADQATVRWRAVVATLANYTAEVIKFSDKMDEWSVSAGKSVTEFAKNAATAVTDFIDGLAVSGARGTAMFLEAFKAMPELFGDIFANAWSFAKSASAEGINELTAIIANSKVGRLFGLEGGTNLDTTLTLRGSGGMGDRIKAAGDQAAAEMRAQIEATKQDQFSQSITPRRATSTVGDARTGGTTGARTSAVKDSGKEAENAAKKYNELITSLTQTAAAQDQMTAAAGRGDVAFEATKVHLEAQEKALSIFGKALSDTDPKLRKIEELLLRISQGKAAEAFSVATTELQRQNVILEAQIRLMNEAPEIQAKEIALIKAKQEAEKAGTAVTQEMIDARTKAIEQNETLKNQQEEIKRAQDLWTAPLKSALESIQSTAADAFQGMLESGKISFQSLGDIFKKTITRMIAEFLALATVRPVMSVLVNAVSPGMAREMGLGGSAGTPGMGNLNTAGGGGIFGNMFGGGGGGGLSNFFGQTLFGGDEVMGPLQPGAASLGSTGGITVGGGLGALAGAGMGAYQLLSGGGSTASTIGGIASLVGAGVSLIPGIGQIAGPIIGLLGGILPGLFGGGTPEPPKLQATGALNFSGGAFNATGGEYGGASSVLGTLGEVGQQMKSVLDAAKVTIQSASQSLTQQTFSQGEFSNATTFVNGQQWGQSSDPAQQKQALDTAAANVAHSIMMEVGSGISDVMREGLKQFGLDNLAHAFSMEELGAAVQKLTAFDDALATFGKTSSEAESAIAQVDSQFDALLDTAKEFALSASVVDQITAERARQRLAATNDFSDAITQGIVEILDPVQAQLNALDKQRQDDIKNNSDFLRLVDGYNDQAADIDRLYYLRRNKVIDDANAAALAAQKQASDAIVSAAANSIGQLQDLIRTLSPGGAQANLDPAGQLAGLKANYTASYAQASADPSNSDAIQRSIQDAQAYTQFAQSYYGGSSAYNQVRDTVLGQAQSLQGGIAAGAMSRVSDPQAHSYLSQIVNNTSGLNERMAQIETLIGLLSRYVANQAA